MFAQTISAPLNKSEKEHFQNLTDSANAYFDSGEFQKSLEVNIELLKKALAANNDDYIFNGYRSIAYDYMHTNDTVLALESFKKAEKYSLKNNNETDQAITYMDLGNIYSSFEGNHTKGLESLDKSIRLFKKIKDTVGIAVASYNAAITALDGKLYEKALKHLIIAKELVPYQSEGYYAAGVEILFGQYYLENEKYEVADIYLLRGLELAKQSNLTPEIEEVYDYYSESLYKQKKFDSAYRTRKLYEIYFEKNLVKSKSAEIEALSNRFQVNEYRKDIKEAELENALQSEILTSKSRTNSILIGITVLGVVLFLALFFAFRKRKQLVTLLQERNKAYLKAKEQSDQLTKSKSEFFSTVSHELRTPLYGVIGLSTLLLEDDSLKSHRKDLNSLKFSADYLLALINDVLQINKIDSKQLNEEASVFNIRELVERLVSSFEYIRIQHKNEMIVNIESEVPEYLKGNPVQLSQILMNLVGNAMKFTENGIVTLKVNLQSKQANFVEIDFSVSDTGIGIAPDKQKHIFNEFSQVDSIDYNYQGTGLGLPIVRRLLRLSNSEITLESKLGEGSKFQFTLSFESISAPKMVKKSNAIDPKILENKKILVVEDNRINQIVTQKILEKKNVTTFLANNGQEAVVKVKDEKFDLVLMDINMPILNGIDATKQIRAFNKTMPIIALTAVEVEEMRQKIYDAGMNDIIVKPYDATLFEQTIVRNLNVNSIPILLSK